MSEETFVSGASIVIFLMLLVYVNMGALIESKKPPFGHETGVVIILGMIISLIGTAIIDDFGTAFRFNDDIFFYVCLPPIVFAAGFNMRRKKFF